MTEEQTSYNLRPVSDMLHLTQRLRLFHEHVDVSGIVLIHNSSLFPSANLLLNAYMLSVDPQPMNFVLIV